MSKITTAMVMAAGHGTRMRPLTHDRSKAMVNVAGLPLIEHLLRRLEGAGIARAVVNIHAHADHLESYLKARDSKLEILISDEREALLETGGGVVKALPMLGVDPILICNIDAVWIEYAPVLSALVAAWNPNIMDELLMLTPQGKVLGLETQGDFDVNKAGQITFRSGDIAGHVYCGIQIFKPELAHGYKLEKFSRKVMWDKSVSKGRAFGHVMAGYWMHVGDPQARRWAEAVIYEARRHHHVGTG